MDAEKAPDPAEEGRTPFAKLIQQQRQGALHTELSEKIAELVQAVVVVEKKGSLVLTINVEPSKDGQTVIISDKIKVTIPEANRGAGIYFVDETGNLSRENPRQARLPLQEVVDRRTGEIKELPNRQEAAE